MSAISQLKLNRNLSSLLAFVLQFLLLPFELFFLFAEYHPVILVIIFVSAFLEQFLKHRSHT